MLQGTILNIQKFSIHDGPGIRTTVFFKGCPLRCAWCHNPESMRFERQLLYTKEKCIHCGRCNHIYDCLSARSDNGDDGFVLAEQAAVNCLVGALEVAGKYYTPQEVVDEVLKDRLFYEESGGGVTFSGGESMAWIDFLEKVARECKKEGLHVAIDTCGYAPYEYFERILPYCDLFLYDLKEMDPVAHKEFTGVDNQLIIDNLTNLSEAGAKIWLRFPIIKGANFREAHIEDLLSLCGSVNHERVSLMPYHPLGAGKREKLGEVPISTTLKNPSSEEFDSPTLTVMSAPSEDEMEALAKRFRTVSNTVHMGG